MTNVTLTGRILEQAARQAELEAADARWRFHNVKIRLAEGTATMEDLRAAELDVHYRNGVAYGMREAAAV